MVAGLEKMWAGRLGRLVVDRFHSMPGRHSKAGCGRGLLVVWVVVDSRLLLESVF